MVRDTCVDRMYRYFRSRILFVSTDHRSKELFVCLDEKQNYEAIFNSTYHISELVNSECVCMQANVSFEIVSIDCYDIVFEYRATNEMFILHHKAID
jgi:hypothetical protein